MITLAFILKREYVHWRTNPMVVANAHTIGVVLLVA